MRLTVTQKNIDTGLRKSTHDCAIARAFGDQGYKAWVYPTLIVVKRPEGLSWLAKMFTPGQVILTMPENGFRFVRDFDAERPVEPIDLILKDLPKRMKRRRALKQTEIFA